MKEIGKGQRKVVLIDYMTEKQRLALDVLFPDHLFEKVEQRESEARIAASFNACGFDPQTTLIVFVGQSSLELKARLIGMINFSVFTTSYVHAQRRYEPIDLCEDRESYSVKVEVGMIAEHDLLTKSRIKNIVVFDDVASTGSTLRVLRERNSPAYPNAAWSAFVLVSRLEKMKGYQKIVFDSFVAEKFTPINTFSKLVEDEVIREKYLLKHFWENSHGDRIINAYGREIGKWLSLLKRRCNYSPRVFCFDLYNTLIVEESSGIMEVGHEIRVEIPDYLDYFVEMYGPKYGLTKASVYAYVRDHLMVSTHDSFESMTALLYKRFVPNEECLTRAPNSPANTVEWAWRARSGKPKWIDTSIPYKLKLLKALGHKLVLITNCTYPAWKEVSRFGSLFDKCFVSSIEGISKPNEAVWQTVENWFPDFPRNKFVMVRDNAADDLLVPESRGWETLAADWIVYDFSEDIVWAE